MVDGEPQTRSGMVYDGGGDGDWATLRMFQRQQMMSGGSTRSAGWTPRRQRGRIRTGGLCLAGRAGALGRARTHKWWLGERGRGQGCWARSFARLVPGGSFCLKRSCGGGEPVRQQGIDKTRGKSEERGAEWGEDAVN